MHKKNQMTVSTSFDISGHVYTIGTMNPNHLYVFSRKNTQKPCISEKVVQANTLMVVTIVYNFK